MGPVVVHGVDHPLPNTTFGHRCTAAQCRAIYSTHVIFIESIPSTWVEGSSKVPCSVAVPGEEAAGADSTPAEQVASLQALLSAAKEQWPPTGIQALDGSMLGAKVLSRVDNHPAFRELFSEEKQQVWSEAASVVQ